MLNVVTVLHNLMATGIKSHRFAAAVAEQAERVLSP